jgi:hypothetical protein
LFRRNTYSIIAFFSFLFKGNDLNFHRKHYHIIESNLKEDKTYLQSEEEILEAIREYRSLQQQQQQKQQNHHNEGNNTKDNCCCGSLLHSHSNSNGEKFHEKSSKHSNCNCTIASVCASSTSSSPQHQHQSPHTQQNKNFIEIRDRLRKKCFLRKVSV